MLSNNIALVGMHETQFWIMSAEMEANKIFLPVYISIVHCVHFFFLLFFFGGKYYIGGNIRG